MGQEVIPIDVPEKRVPLHISSISWATPNSMSGIPLQKLFGKVPGIRGEVGGQHQLPFNDFIHSFLPVLCGEGRLEKAEGEGSLGVLPPSPAPTWKGSPQHPPCSQGSGTCRSSEHVVHQGSQAPPVHCPVVTDAH